MCTQSRLVEITLADDTTIRGILLRVLPYGVDIPGVGSLPTYEVWCHDGTVRRVLRHQVRFLDTHATHRCT